MGRSSNFYISCTFAYKTSQLYLKSHASSSQRKSSRIANLVLHLGHFSVVMSEPTLSIFHSARLRPIICSPLPSVARSSSSIGKRPIIQYKWRKVKRGRPAIPSTKGKILAPPQSNARWSAFKLGDKLCASNPFLLLLSSYTRCVALKPPIQRVPVQLAAIEKLDPTLIQDVECTSSSAKVGP